MELSIISIPLKFGTKVVNTIILEISKNKSTYSTKVLRYKDSKFGNNVKQGLNKLCTFTSKNYRT